MIYLKYFFEFIFFGLLFAAPSAFLRWAIVCKQFSRLTAWLISLPYFFVLAVWLKESGLSTTGSHAWWPALLTYWVLRAERSWKQIRSETISNWKEIYHKCKEEARSDRQKSSEAKDESHGKRQKYVRRVDGRQPQQIQGDGRVLMPNGEVCPVSHLDKGTGVIVTYCNDGKEEFRTYFKKGLFARKEFFQTKKD
jgi:hypothetical protein